MQRHSCSAGIPRKPAAAIAPGTARDACRNARTFSLRSAYAVTKKALKLADNRTRFHRRVRADDGILRGKALEVQQKREQAFEMRLQGFTSFRVIGEALGLSGARARQLIEEEIENRQVGLVDELRFKMSERYEALLTPHFANALNGDFAASNICLRIMEDYGRLCGLDAP